MFVIIKKSVRSVKLHEVREEGSLAGVYPSANGKNGTGYSFWVVSLIYYW